MSDKIDQDIHPDCQLIKRGRRYKSVDEMVWKTSGLRFKILWFQDRVIHWILKHTPWSL